MASLAFVSKTSGVLVLHLMAADARRRDSAVALATMTGCTRDSGMGTNQLEACFIVVEGLGRQPGILAVAIVATLTQPLLMRLIIAMARRTIRCRLT